jgi:hypothetical protein
MADQAGALFGLAAVGDVLHQHQTGRVSVAKQGVTGDLHQKRVPSLRTCCHSQ